MKRATLFVLFGGGVAFSVALIGLLFFSWRPATLRIAVGPPGSDDVRVVQNIAQGFSRERHYVRLQVVVTAAGVGSGAARRRHRGGPWVVGPALTPPPAAPP